MSALIGSQKIVLVFHKELVQALAVRLSQLEGSSARAAAGARSPLSGWIARARMAVFRTSKVAVFDIVKLVSGPGKFRHQARHLAGR
jgi:hypothetical protein